MCVYIYVYIVHMYVYIHMYYIYIYIYECIYIYIYRERERGRDLDGIYIYIYVYIYIYIYTPNGAVRRRTPQYLVFSTACWSGDLVCLAACMAACEAVSAVSWLDVANSMGNPWLAREWVTYMGKRARTCASHRTEPHRTASHLIASHRIASCFKRCYFEHYYLVTSKWFRNQYEAAKSDKVCLRPARKRLGKRASGGSLAWSARPQKNGNPATRHLRAT